MVEIGQMAFGNKWESRRAPDWMADGLEELREVAAPGEAWWSGVTNPTFEIRPYYWGDCQCGYEQAEMEWSEAHAHADNCYQGSVRAAKLAAGWTPAGFFGLLDSPKSLTYGESRKAETSIYRAACEKHGIPWAGGQGCAVHCTCEHDRLWREWSAANDHAPTCPTVLPNFLHKPSGLAVHWYKHIGRSMTCNRSISRAEWRQIVADCMAEVEPRYELTDKGRELLGGGG